jgi:hypothetical protein
MTLTEFGRSTWGKVAVALALFLAGYYFPLFGWRGSSSAPAAQAAASAPHVGTASSRELR